MHHHGALKSKNTIEEPRPKWRGFFFAYGIDNCNSPANPAPSRGEYAGCGIQMNCSPNTLLKSKKTETLAYVKKYLPFDSSVEGPMFLSLMLLISRINLR